MIDLVATVLVRSERQAFEASVMVLLDKVWTLHKVTLEERVIRLEQAIWSRVYKGGYSCTFTRVIGPS